LTLLLEMGAILLIGILLSLDERDFLWL
jgi:hypothetical protein